MSAKQLTLAGEETEKQRIRPDTLVKCYHCEEYVLRSRFASHEEHNREAQRRITERIAKEAENEDPPEQVGAWYDIRLHYTAEYSFRIPAWDEHHAEELAKEWHWDTKPADEYHVHTDRREIKEIYEDDPDLPDDFDMYGSETLYQAFQRAKDEETDGDGS